MGFEAPSLNTLSIYIKQFVIPTTQENKLLKWRKGITGDVWTQAQKDTWQARVTTFFKPISGESAETKKKRMKYIVKAVPRQATLHWLRDCSNAMKGAILVAECIRTSKPELPRARIYFRER